MEDPSSPGSEPGDSGDMPREQRQEMVDGGQATQPEGGALIMQTAPTVKMQSHTFIKEN